MCGRYTLTTPAEAVNKFFGLAPGPNLAPRYNIAPSQDVLAVRNTDSGGRAFASLRWGLIPSWSKDPATGHRTINARAETVAEKPSFRAAYRKRRCLIAADGFYEWQKQKAGTRAKQPYWIAMADQGPFAFAGLWEHWQAPDGENIESCTIVTCPANDLVKPIHDRMPVILAPGDIELWIDTGANPADLLKPFSAAAMMARPVSTHVNSPANDDPNCIAEMLL